MYRELLDNYARLLTTDSRACAELFDRDAEYIHRLGTYDLHLRGREEIASFIRHVPRQISFRAGRCHPEGDGYRGEVMVLANGFEPFAQRILYSVESGRFTRFETVRR